MYDPNVGQFLTPDPIEDDRENTRRYVGNSPTNATDSTGLKDDSILKGVGEEAPTGKKVWRGARIIANKMGYPTFLMDWNESNNTDVRKGEFLEGSKYITRITGKKLIVVGDNIAWKAMLKVGTTGKFDPKKHSPLLGSVYNEAFHAFFHKDVAGERVTPKESLWLRHILSKQKQFSHKVMAEEAMSSLVDHVVNELASGRPIFNYERALAASERSNWYKAIRPGHNERKGDTFFGKAGADEPMSKDLYYATLWLIEHGIENPAGPGRLTEFKISKGVEKGFFDSPIYRPGESWNFEKARRQDLEKDDRVEGVL